MSRMVHTSLVGKLTYDEALNEFLVDGFSILAELDKMSGLEVQLEIVGYDKNPPAPTEPDSEAPGTEFIQKLMGGDGSTS